MTGPAPDVHFPVFRISDAVNEAGQPGFYFLPPLAPNPGAFSGTFDAALVPTVKICALAAGECIAPEVAELTTGGKGAAGISVNLSSQSYNATWKTKGLALNPATDYRLRVYVGTRLLGWLDLDVVASPQALKGVAADEVGLVRDQPLTIKFRIETGIVGEVAVDPAAATVAVGGTQQFTAALRDLHGVVLVGPAIAWSSADAGVGTVSTAGLVTGVAAGTATITATSQGIGGTATLTVESATPQWTLVTHALPTMHLKALWGSASGEFFAVGYGGKIAHNDGAGWSQMASGTYQTLTGVWGVPGGDVYAAGGLTIVRWNGTSWSAMAAPSNTVMQWIYGIWGTSASDLYIVGHGTQGDAMVMRWDGSVWSEVYRKTNDFMSSSQLQAIWGISGPNLWAVGRHTSSGDGYVIRRGSMNWYTERSVSGYTTLYAAWGSAADDVFAVGNGGTILHYDGAAWTTMASGTWTDLRGVWGSAANDVYAVGAGGTVLHYDGTSWSPVSHGLTTNYLNAIWGSSATDIFAVGDLTTILHFGM